MTISWVQASILGIFASLSSMPGTAGSTIGNYTLGRPLVGGLFCGLVLGDLKTGIAAGVAMQLVYIALVNSWRDCFGGSSSGLLYRYTISNGCYSCSRISSNIRKCC